MASAWHSRRRMLQSDTSLSERSGPEGWLPALSTSSSPGSGSARATQTMWSKAALPGDLHTPALLSNYPEFPDSSFLPFSIIQSDCFKVIFCQCHLRRRRHVFQLVDNSPEHIQFAFAVSFDFQPWLEFINRFLLINQWHFLHPFLCMKSSLHHSKGMFCMLL